MPLTVGEMNLTLPDARPQLDDLLAWGKSLELSAQAYANQVQHAVSHLLSGGVRFDEGWKLICSGVLQGEAAEAHSVREQFLSAFEEWHRQLVQAGELVRSAERAAQRSLPEASQLADEAKRLEAKVAKLRTRWQKVEDLEDLAAESLAPSKAKLEAVQRKYGYPQAWYDDDSKPF